MKIAEMSTVEPSQVHLFLSGRAALFHLIASLDLEDGAEALVTGFTCEAVALPLLENKVHVRYLDISEKDYSIDPNKIESHISTRTRILLVQHSFGIPPQRKELLCIARKYNLIVIEDLAHGWRRGVFDDDESPTIKLLSFGRSKAVSSVFGGCIISSGNELAKTLNDVEKRLPQLSPTALFRLLLYKPYAVCVKNLYNVLFLGKIIHLIGTKSGFIIPEISATEKQGCFDLFFDKAYPNALAALLIPQLNRLLETEKTRRYSCSVYQSAFLTEYDDGLALARFPVLVKDRDSLIQQAKRKGWFFGRWYTQPVAPAELDLGRVGYIPGSCPRSEKVCQHIINLPTMVGEREAHQIANSVKPHLLKLDRSI